MGLDKKQNRHMIGFFIIPYMAYLSRMCGGGWPKLPWKIEHILYALPFALLYPIIGWWCVPCILLIFAGKLMGTRQYLDGGTWEGKTRPNNLDFLISWLYDRVSPRTYDFIGNTVLGIASVLIPSIILLCLGLAGYALLMGGVMRGFAYAIGWGIDGNNGSVIGEYLSGSFVGFGLWLILVS